MGNSSRKAISRKAYVVLSTFIVLSMVAMVFTMVHQHKQIVYSLSKHHVVNEAEMLAKYITGPVKWNKPEVIKERYQDLVNGKHANIASLMVIDDENNRLDSFKSTKLEPFSIEHIRFTPTKITMVQHEAQHLLITTPIVSSQDKIIGNLILAYSLKESNIFENSILMKEMMLFIVVIVAALTALRRVLTPAE